MNKKLGLITVGLLVLFIIFTFFNTFYQIEYNLQDMLNDIDNSNTIKSEKSGIEVSEEILILGIDEESLEKYGRWPWDRNKITELLKILQDGSAAVIGIDILFTEKSGKEMDDALVDEIKKHDNIILAKMGKFNDYSKANELKAIKLTKPFTELDEVADSGHINVFIDKDGIVRKSPLFYEYNNEIVESFSYKIYKKYCEAYKIKPVDLNDIPLDEWNRMRITFTEGNKYKTSDGTKTNIRYQELPISKVLEGKIPPEYFEGRIVLIGPYATGIDDYYYTPLIKDEPVFGIQINATIIQNLIENNFKKEVSQYINIIILISIALFTSIIFRKARPIFSMLIAMVTIGIYMVICFVLYRKNIIVYISYSIIWICMHYIIAIIIRYVEKMKEVREITNMFGRYVSPKIVKEIVAKGEKSLELGGVKKYVTLFFVDIRGFTTISEHHEPEEVVKILNEYFETCVESIFKYDGTLDKFVGDEIMAVFGAPVDLPNHELAAVRAAIDMRDNGKKLHQRIKEKFDVDLSFGIGLNSGYAVVGNIGTSFKMDYTCIGDAVNAAARLQAMTKGGQIIISQAVYEKVKDYIEVIDLGETHVKGKEEGIQIYEVVREIER